MMKFPSALVVGSLAAVLFNCSSGGDGDGGWSTGGASGAAGASKGGNVGRGGSSAGAGGSQPVTCADFGYVASGASCPATGCPAFSCSCPGSFPISLTSCSSDGCLIAADCDVLCAERLEGGFECIDTYTIAPASGGSTGSGGSGGTGGAAPEPVCEASYVKVQPTSSSLLPASATGQRLLSDPSGNVYVTGLVPDGQAVDFGGGELASGKRLFLLKLDAKGSHVWSRRFGSSFGLEKIETLSFARDGGLWVGGITAGATDLGGGAEPVASVPQLFAARYDTDGNFVASYLLPTSNSIAHLSAVLEMPNGEVHFWGDFSSTFTASTTELTSKGENDIFLVRFSSAGEILEAKSYGGLRNDLIFDAVADETGQTYLVGFSFYDVDFGSDPIDLGNNALSFAVKLDAARKPVWQKLIGSGGSYPRRILLRDTELIIGGDAYSSIWYETSDNGLPKGDLYVLRVNAENGALISGKSFASEGSGARLSVLTPIANGGYAFAGSIKPPANFGGGEMAEGVGADPFVAAYDASGAHLWSTFFCATSGATVNGFVESQNSPIVLVEFAKDLTTGTQQFSSKGSALLTMPASP